MGRGKPREDEDESESIGTDLEQMVAMLEKAEVDYEQETDDEGQTELNVNDTSIFVFDEDGNLLEVGGV